MLFIKRIALAAGGLFGLCAEALYLCNRASAGDCWREAGLAASEIELGGGRSMFETNRLKHNKK